MRALVGSPPTAGSNYKSKNTGTITGGGSFFPKRTSKQDAAKRVGGGDVAGCFVMLLVLAFYAGCALVVIALMVWAWHYLFG